MNNEKEIEKRLYSVRDNKGCCEHCFGELAKDALDYINRLKEKIHEIRQENIRDRKRVRKDTAKDILRELSKESHYGYDYPDEPHSMICIFDPFFFEEMERRYGVEVDE